MEIRFDKNVKELLYALVLKFVPTDEPLPDELEALIMKFDK